MNCPDCKGKVSVLVPKTIPSADKSTPVHEHLVCTIDEDHRAYCLTQHCWVK